jgi:outer membrane lipoprotein-sorting protein
MCYPKMNTMKRLMLLVAGVLMTAALFAQNEEAMLQKVKTKMEKVTDYEATGKMRLDVSFINAPESDVTIYFKRPNKFKVKKAGGISILPKGGVSVNMSSLLPATTYQTVPGGLGVVDGKQTTIIKLIPTNEASDVVLSTLYIDEKDAVIRKAVVTTKESGTYDVQMNYGKYTAWGLPDKVVFSFNTKDYKLPKGITFEYEKGGEKKPDDQSKNKKGTVTISYEKYKINKGVDDKNFQ